MTDDARRPSLLVVASNTDASNAAMALVPPSVHAEVLLLQQGRSPDPAGRLRGRLRALARRPRPAASPATVVRQACAKARPDAVVVADREVLKLCARAVPRGVVVVEGIEPAVRLVTGQASLVSSEARPPSVPPADLEWWAVGPMGDALLGGALTRCLAAGGREARTLEGGLSTLDAAPDLSLLAAGGLPWNSGSAPDALVVADPDAIPRGARAGVVVPEERVVDPREHAERWSWSVYRSMEVHELEDAHRRFAELQARLRAAEDRGHHVATLGTGAGSDRRPCVPQPFIGVVVGSAGIRTSRSGAPLVALLGAAPGDPVADRVERMVERGMCRSVRLESVPAALRLLVLNTAALLVDRPGHGTLSWAGLERLRHRSAVVCRAEAMPSFYAESGLLRDVDELEDLVSGAADPSPVHVPEHWHGQLLERHSDALVGAALAGLIAGGRT